MSLPTPTEIEGQLNEAVAGTVEGCPFPGLSYSEGVQAALDWVLGNTADPPMTP